jgi:phage terminase large subunit-like protein
VSTALDLDEEEESALALESVDPLAWNLSCPDWLQRMKEGRPLVPELPLYLDEAERGLRAFNKLRLGDVPGTPLLADACGPWFTEIVRALFGSFNRATRRRMIREIFALVPKKNSKTSYGALLMLTALLLNDRPQATFLMMAPVLDTANMAFDQCDAAIKLDPVLTKLLDVKSHLKTIIHRITGAELEIVTFDPSVATGRKVSGGALLDELHVCAKMGAKADSVIRQLRGGMMPFPEAFLAFITTQSEEVPSGAMLDELTYARDIRDGNTAGDMLPVLYEFPPEMQAIPEDGSPPQWKDPANWHLVTPNLGRSISIETLQKGMIKEARKGEAQLRAWASQHLNVQIGIGLHAKSWSAAQFWQACGVEYLSGGKEGLRKLLERSVVVVAGIDGGGLDDLLALVVIGRDAEGNWLVWCHAWCHESVLVLRKSEAAKFRQFERDGDLTIVKNTGPDIEEMGDYIEECEKTGLLDRVGVDQAGIQDVVDELEKRGLDRETRIVGIKQGWAMVGAVKTTERHIQAKRIKHGAQRLMAYALGNAKVEPRGNAVIITKETAGKAKVDPVLAMLNACTLMGLNPKPRKKLYQFFVVGGQ